MISRRNFCAGFAASLIAGPYVIRNSGVLMPVRDRSLRIVYAIKHTEGRYPEQPIGVIFPFRGKPPKGWLPFDGRTITQGQYPELFKLANWSDLGNIQLKMAETHIPSLCGVSSIKPLLPGWNWDQTG